MALKHVEALYGPYAGAIIAIEEDDADKAIADGWARDPYDPKNALQPTTDLSGKPQKTEDFDAEKMAAATKQAEDYAARVRGVVDDEDQKKSRRTTSNTEGRTTTAGGSTSSYQTRESKAAESKKSSEE